MRSNNLTLSGEGGALEGAVVLVPSRAKPSFSALAVGIVLFLAEEGAFASVVLTSKGMDEVGRMKDMPLLSVRTGRPLPNSAGEPVHGHSARIEVSAHACIKSVKSRFSQFFWH